MLWSRARYAGLNLVAWSGSGRLVTSRRRASVAASVENNERPGHFSPGQGLEPFVDFVERNASGYQVVEVEPARYSSTKRGMSRRNRFEPMREPWSRFSETGRSRGSRDLARRDHADHGGGAAAPEHGEGLLGAAGQPDGLEGVVHAAAGQLEHGGHRVVGGVDRVGGAHGPGQVQLGGHPVDGDDPLGSGDGRALDGRSARRRRSR